MAMGFSSGRVQVLSHRRRRIPAAGVRALFDEEGWWPDRAEPDLALVIDAGPAVAAWDGAALIGFGRAVTDGRFRAYLEDIIVRRDRRGRGIGALMVRALHRELAPQVIASAFFHAPLETFYGRLGYVPTRQVVAHRKGGSR